MLTGLRCAARRASARVEFVSPRSVANIKLDELTDSVGVVAHVFKRYLQSLPEPLMTFRLYDSFVLATCVFCLCNTALCKRRSHRTRILFLA